MCFINSYRIYLIAITISNITEPGKHICPEVYHHDKALTWRQSRYIRCNQQLPEKRQWYMWRELLKSLTFIIRRRLKQALDDWITPVDQIRTRYQAYRIKDQVYERKKPLHQVGHNWIQYTSGNQDWIENTSSQCNTLQGNNHKHNRNHFP
jgi:hypothetical protein